MLLPLACHDTPFQTQGNPMAIGQPPHLALWLPVMGHGPNDAQAEHGDRVGVEAAW